MVALFNRTDKRKASTAFTLVEVVMSIAILALAMSGLIYGYVQTNYRAQWSSMSLAAQSFATQAVEQIRAAQWDYNGTGNQFAPTSYSTTNTLLIPGTGQSTNAVTTVNVTNVLTNPWLSQIRADCVWYFPGKTNQFTNTVITWRAPNR
jgi:type II secretory pathway pseudopilin PulG